MAKRYHFSLGNSATGPIGFCATVRADSKEAALTRLKRDMIPVTQEAEIFGTDDEYIEVYFNTSALSIDDIDEVI